MFKTWIFWQIPRNHYQDLDALSVMKKDTITQQKNLK